MLTDSPGGKVRLLAVTLLVLLSPASPNTARGAEGPTSSASVTVSARIRPSAAVGEVRHPSSLIITEADARRGYVDVPGGSSAAVRASAGTGYVLDIRVPNDLVLATEVRGMGRPRLLAPGGGTIVRQAAAPVNERLTLRWRFYLRENARPGRYEWPVALSARPRVGLPGSRPN